MCSRLSPCSGPIQPQAQSSPMDSPASNASSIIVETPLNTAASTNEGMGTHGKTNKQAAKLAQAETSLLATVQVALDMVKAISSKVLGRTATIKQLEKAITMIKEDAN